MYMWERVSESKWISGLVYMGSKAQDDNVLRPIMVNRLDHIENRMRMIAGEGRARDS